MCAKLIKSYPFGATNCKDRFALTPWSPIDVLLIQGSLLYLGCLLVSSRSLNLAPKSPSSVVARCRCADAFGGELLKILWPRDWMWHSYYLSAAPCNSKDLKILYY